MGELFSMQGRYKRSTYFWTLLLINIIVYIASFILGLVVGASGGDQATASALSLLISIPASIISAFQVVKRLHDLNRPGTHFWMMLIPLYNIYLGLILLFQRGTVGPNNYGPDPIGEPAGLGYSR